MCLRFNADEPSPSPSLKGRGILIEPRCDSDWKRGERRQTRECRDIADVGRCATEQPATQKRD